MLRNYQRQALEALRENISKGVHKNLVVLPTGGGKTALFCEIMALASKNGKRSLMAVRGRKLVSQAADRLRSQGLDFSVVMAGDDRIDESKLIQAASIDTLFQRKIELKPDIIVIDEAHLAITPSFRWLIESNPQAAVLAFTATPYHKEGFRSLASRIVSTVSVRDLIDQGFLVPAKYFSPSFPDLSTVKKSGDDFVAKDLAAAMNQSRLFGDVIESYKNLGENRPAILFAVNIAHSVRLAKAFNDAGIPAKHVDGMLAGVEREQVIDDLVNSRIKIICSVGIITTGVDIPPCSCIIFCRPTLSYSLYKQMIGRGSRPFKSKENFIVLDHAGNVMRHGFYEDEKPFSLDGKPPSTAPKIYTCASCYAVFERSLGKCPATLADGSECETPIPPAKERPKAEIKVLEKIKMIELNGETIEFEEMKLFILKTGADALKRGYNQKYLFMQILKRYGKEAAKASWPAIRAIYGQAEI